MEWARRETARRRDGETAGQTARRVWRRWLSRVGRELSPIAAATLFALPFLVMVLTSFKTEADTFRLPPRLWPDSWVLDNYRRVFDAMPFWRYLGNTLFLAGLAVAGTLFSCPLVAYSLAKVPWRGRNLLFVVVISTMMLPPQITMIPVYVMWNRTPLMGTYWPLSLPHFLGTAFFIFLLRQFFMAIPNDLLDAARVDGASEFRVYRDVVLPLARPALATIAVFAFVWSWTDFLNPLIYLNDAEKYTLSIGLYNFFSEHGVEWGPLMAACTIFSLPLVGLFLVAQRQFMEGISLTGFK
jgi:multiple sugar transport system permease protein